MSANTYENLHDMRATFMQLDASDRLVVANVLPQTANVDNLLAGKILLRMLENDDAISEIFLESFGLVCSYFYLFFR